MIDKSLQWAYESESLEDWAKVAFQSSNRSEFSFVDVGCGVGGSSRLARSLHLHIYAFLLFFNRHIAKSLKNIVSSVIVKGQGISLSPYQVGNILVFHLSIHPTFQ